MDVKYLTGAVHHCHKRSGGGTMANILLVVGKSLVKVITAANAPQGVDVVKGWVG
jgi:hypothetical protein